jgi:hypothetical protein
LRKFWQDRAVGDNRRLPAAFIIDRGGTIRWTWRGKDTADNASTEDPLSALDNLNLSQWIGIIVIDLSKNCFSFAQRRPPTAREIPPSS